MKSQRHHSLDVFRGATVAFMILVNNPGTWEHVFLPLRHAVWHGCTPTDLVFPFFLFAVGNSMAFVIPKLQEYGREGEFWRKITKRTIWIFLIGFGLNWFPFLEWSNGDLQFKKWVDDINPDDGIRVMGVLQRIALAYFIASILVFYYKPRNLIYISTVVLLGYWGLCAVLGTGDPYSLEGWFGLQVDKNVLGVAHMYKGEGVPFEPEGLISTIPSVVQVVFGYLVGLLIKAQGNVKWLWSKVPISGEKHFKLLSGMFITGFILFVLALLWDLAFPINKKIWTSSYVLYTTGLGIMVIGCAIWFTEVLNTRNWLTKFFDVFGKNPLFIFVLSMLVPNFMVLIRIPFQNDYVNPLTWFYQNICAYAPGTPEFGSLLYSVCFLALMWLIAYGLDQKKIYIKV